MQDGFQPGGGGNYLQGASDAYKVIAISPHYSGFSPLDALNPAYRDFALLDSGVVDNYRRQQMQKAGVINPKSLLEAIAENGKPIIDIRPTSVSPHSKIMPSQTYILQQYNIA